MITAKEKARATHIVVDDRKGNVGVAAAPMGSAGAGAADAAAPQKEDGKWRPTTLQQASAEQKRAMLASMLDENTTKIKLAQVFLYSLLLYC